MSRSFFLWLTLIPACFEPTPFDGSNTSTDSDGCSPGHAGCACLENHTCLAGFQCLAGQCSTPDNTPDNPSANTLDSTLDSTGPETGAGSSDTTVSTSSTDSEDTGGSTTEIPAGSTSGSTSNSSTTSPTDDDSTGDTDSNTDPTSTEEETCDPFSTRCLNAQQIQHCNAQGRWDPPQTCVDQACVNGQCTGECAPGTTECLDLDHMRTCEDTGLWGNPSACVDQSCIGNRCTGECAQGQVHCQGNTVQHCNTVGLWKDDFDCEAPKEICEEGMCVEACTPWTKQLGTSEADAGEGIAIDASGNVFMTGEAYGTFDGQSSAGRSDAFVAKYSPSGTKLWVEQFGTSEADGGSGVALDASGNVFMTGYTEEAFDGQSTAGARDIFVAKYSPSGTKLWVKQFGTAGNDGGGGIAVGASGNVFLTGSTWGTFDGESSVGSVDAFVAKYNPAGTKLWVKQFGASQFDVGSGIAVDASGNAFITGDTDGNFDGQSTAGRSDAFVAKYSPSGTKLWVKQFGTSDFDSGRGIAVESFGRISIIGTVNGTFAGNSSAGKRDASIVRLCDDTF